MHAVDLISMAIDLALLVVLISLLKRQSPAGSATCSAMHTRTGEGTDSLPTGLPAARVTAEGLIG